MALSTTRPLVSTGRMLRTAVDRTGCSRGAIGSAGPEAKRDGAPIPGRAAKGASQFSPRARGEIAGHGVKGKLGVQTVPEYGFWGANATKSVRRGT